MSGAEPLNAVAVPRARTAAADGEDSESHAIAIPSSAPNQGLATSWYSSTPPIAISAGRVSQGGAMEPELQQYFCYMPGKCTYRQSISEWTTA